jgi:hypothetical protein
MAIDRDEHPRSPWLMIGLIGLFLAPPLYLLSMGPVAWLMDNFGGGQWYDVIYFPANWIYDTFPATQPWFVWYLDWWT